jgi:hypothetical protein
MHQHTFDYVVCALQVAEFWDIYIYVLDSSLNAVRHGIGGQFKALGELHFFKFFFAVFLFLSYIVQEVNNV